MAIDASIYRAFAPQQRSAMQYASDFDALQADRVNQRELMANNALARTFNTAKLEDFQQQRQRANALAALQQSLAGKPDDEVLAGLRGAGQFDAAGSFEKGMLERRKTRGEITKDAATAEKTFGEAQADALKRYRGALDYIASPAGAQRWLQAQYADPLLAQHMQSLGPIEKAIGSIPQDPAGFDQWRQRAAMGMEGWLKQRLEQDKAAQAARNNLIGPDGKPNQALVGVKTTIARAGASQVNVHNTQEKEESKAVGKFLGEQYADIQKAGIAATGKVDRAGRMEQLLDRINTGRLEGVKKEVAAIAAGFGIQLDPNLGDKEAFEALSNQLALEARNPSGGAGMPGAMSDKDREFLVQITPNLTKTPEGNRQIIETTKKLAKREAEVARMAREYRAKAGTLDEGFFEELRQFSNANPLFGGPPAAGRFRYLGKE